MTDSHPPLLIAPPPPGWAQQTARPSGPTGMATASLVLGIVALLLNVLLVPTVLAIVFGAVALSKGTAARVRSIVGIVLGCLGILAVAVQAAVAIPVFLAAQHAAVASGMTTSITSGLAARGVTVSGVVCVPPTAIRAGATTTCTATTTAGDPITIDVTFTDSRGDFTFRPAQG